MDEFRRDLSENLKAIEDARERLLGRLRPLSAEDLQCVGRGGWSVQEVMRPVIDSEVAYAPSSVVQ